MRFRDFGISSGGCSITFALLYAAFRLLGESWSNSHAQVVGVLFEVERLREDQPRNILRVIVASSLGERASLWALLYFTPEVQMLFVLQLLSTNTRRTKVVELSSGTHRQKSYLNFQIYAKL